MLVQLRRWNKNADIKHSELRLGIDSDKMQEEKQKSPGEYSSHVVRVNFGPMTNE